MKSIRAYSDPTTIPASESARLAQILSLTTSNDFDDVALARRVTDGLPVASIAGLERLLGEMQVVGAVVPEATLRRMRKAGKPLPREHSERLYELSRVIDAVGQAFHGDATQITTFLSRPHPLLGGETPLNLARSSSAGADAVLNLVRRAEAGVAL